MKRYSYLLFLLFAFIEINCLSEKEKLSKLWFYTYSSGNSKYEDTVFTHTSFINLQADNTYTLDFGSFDYGRWNSDKGWLSLRSSGGRVSSYRIAHLQGNELNLTDDKGIVLNFDGRPFKFTNSASNPFSIDNNQWRIPAVKKESEQELKKRLSNHCKFYETYFLWALENDLNSVDVRSTPSPIKIYGNGFALKKFDELPMLWRSYFYDAADCQKANDIIKSIFESKDITWANTDNKYKMFVSAFQQMQRLIK
jgi:hypothetical protein